ncbi:MAG: Uncharacterised protein [Cyanobium sp. ARS6]|nr:MAG: Uncharacterised protein [Cyanobium sp. ARS6]
MQDLRHLLRNRCFSGSWLTCERHVQARGPAHQIQGLSSLIHQQQSRDLTNSGFDGPQTDQLGVQMVEDLTDSRSNETGFQINR